MKKLLILCSGILVLSLFSVFYEGEKQGPIREIASVKDESEPCVIEDSQWGKQPAPITREAICKCHPELCPKDIEGEIIPSPSPLPENP